MEMLVFTLLTASLLSRAESAPWDGLRLKTLTSSSRVFNSAPQPTATVVSHPELFRRSTSEHNSGSVLGSSSKSTNVSLATFAWDEKRCKIQILSIFTRPAIADIM
jgi:hypothetical protein